MHETDCAFVCAFIIGQDAQNEKLNIQHQQTHVRNYRSLRVENTKTTFLVT